MTFHIKFIILVIIPLFSSCIFRMDNAPTGPDGLTLAEHLGFPSDAKLLVVNSDDAGAHPAFTEGTLDAMEAGLITSTSILVHDRNDKELQMIAAASQAHPQWGFGVHLSLTNSFQEAHPWKPVLSYEKAPSLYNENNLPWATVSEAIQNVDPREAEMEFEAQILKAVSFGIQPTHLDSHMGTYYRDSEYPGAEVEGLRQAALSVAMKYNLPMTMNTFSKKGENQMAFMDENRIIRPDTFFGFYEIEEINRSLGYSGNGLKKALVKFIVKMKFGFNLPYEGQTELEKAIPVRMEIYKQALRGLARPGLNHFLMHAAYPESADGTAVPGGVRMNAHQIDLIRRGDIAVWTSDEMRDFLKEENIHLVNYGDLQKLQARWAEESR